MPNWQQNAIAVPDASLRVVDLQSLRFGEAVGTGKISQDSCLVQMF